MSRRKKRKTQFPNVRVDASVPMGTVEMRKGGKVVGRIKNIDLHSSCVRSVSAGCAIVLCCDSCWERTFA